MKNRKDLPIGMGMKTESMIHELEIHLQVNGHDLIRKMIGNLNDPTIKNEFMEYNRVNQIKRIEKSSRIRGFKFKERWSSEHLARSNPESIRENPDSFNNIYKSQST